MKKSINAGLVGLILGFNNLVYADETTKLISKLECHPDKKNTEFCFVPENPQSNFFKNVQKLLPEILDELKLYGEFPNKFSVGNSFDKRRTQIIPSDGVFLRKKRGNFFDYIPRNFGSVKLNYLISADKKHVIAKVNDPIYLSKFNIGDDIDKLRLVLFSEVLHSIFRVPSGLVLTQGYSMQDLIQTEEAVVHNLSRFYAISMNLKEKFDSMGKSLKTEKRYAGYRKLENNPLFDDSNYSPQNRILIGNAYFQNPVMFTNLIKN